MKEAFGEIRIEFFYLFIFSCVVATYLVIKGPQGFMNFDGEYYIQIVKEGYKYDPSYHGSNTAFNPLFGYVWSLVGFRIVPMVILNAIFFICGLSLLRRTNLVNESGIHYFLCLPFIMFFFIPYTESLYFLLTSAFIFFFDRKFFVSLVFIALASATKFSTLITLLVILATMIFSLNKKSGKEIVWKSFLLIAVAGIVSFVIERIKDVQTGIPNVSMKAQRHYWKQFIQLPKFPFDDWGGEFIMILDGWSFILACVCLVLIISKFWKRYALKVQPEDTWTYLQSFSMISLAAFVPLQLFIKATEIHSLGRYVYCNPFILIALPIIIKELEKLSMKQVVIMLLLGSIALIPFFMRHFISYLALWGYIVIQLALMKNQKLIYVGIFLGLVVNTVLLVRFIDGAWTG